jgi:hypothetical protein
MYACSFTPNNAASKNKNILQVNEPRANKNMSQVNEPRAMIDDQSQKWCKPIL